MEHARVADKLQAALEYKMTPLGAILYSIRPCMVGAEGLEPPTPSV